MTTNALTKTARNLVPGDRMGARTYIHSVETKTLGKYDTTVVSYTDKPGGEMRGWKFDYLAADSTVRLYAPKPKAEKVVHAPVPVGTVFVSTWGYVQTNVDFYRVVRSTASTVWVEPMGVRMVEAQGYGCETVVAQPVGNPGAVSQHRVRWHGETPSFSVNSFASASHWDGKPMLRTWGR